MSSIEISVPPDEGISSIHFCPTNQKIISTTSWAGTVRMYDIESNEQIENHTFNSPLLCSTFYEGNTLISGGTDGNIYLSSSDTVLKGHTAGVSSVSLFPESQLLLSSSWDQSLCMWDLKQPSETNLIGTLEFKEKIMFAGACSDNRIVAYGHRNTVYVIDTRNPSQIERRVSSLGKQIRSFAVSAPNQFGWAVGSIDGRIAIEYFGDLKHQAQRFSFSCNRNEEGEKVIVYPVSYLCFHPVSGVLTSGSCDGSIYFWDIENKRKLTEIQSPIENSMAAMDYNSDGSFLSMAFSYTWEKGDIEHLDDRVLLYSPNSQSVSLSRKIEE